MLFMRVVETSAAVASTASRLGKVGQLADCLKHASDEDDAGTIATVVAFLSGDLTQRQIGVGWASLRDMPSAASAPTLTVREVDETFSRVGGLSGVGSQAERRAALAELFSKATESEQRFLYGLLSGELRQGALDGVMTDAIAKAAAIPIAEVRRAMMLHGSLGPVAQAALQGGSAALAEVGLHVGRPVKPMLAETAESLDAALTRLSRPAGKARKGAEPTSADSAADSDSVPRSRPCTAMCSDVSGPRISCAAIDRNSSRLPSACRALARSTKRSERYSSFESAIVRSASAPDQSFLKPRARARSA